MRRTDTESTTHLRSKSRIFWDKGRWFYHTREGVRGPFVAEPTAVVDLTLYAETMSFLERSSSSIPPHIDTNNVELHISRSGEDC